MKNTKRAFGLLLAMALLVSLFAGCGKDTDPTFDTASGGSGTGSQVSAPGAKGKYIEQDFPMPIKDYAMDMVMLDSGALRLAVRDVDIYTTDPGRTTWEHTMTLPEEITSSGMVESLALSPKGDIFVSTIRETEEEGTYESHFWLVTDAGEVREIPITYPELDNTRGYLAGSCDFTESGKLMVKFLIDDVRELDLETGALSENRNELSGILNGVVCAGEDSYMLGYGGKASVYREGAVEELTGVLGDQIAASLKASEGSAPKVTLWKNAEGYLFFTTEEGLFSYVPEGSVTEELVSGARTTLGDPTFYPLAMTGGEDGSFYVLGNSGGESHIFRYVYDADAPTVPETNLRVYSLYEDENLRQMISQYQKAHPEVSVDLEIGVTGENGVTQADAIRTLNTEILAGSGPDIIELDGFSLDTFLKKDLLADLSGVLSQQPLLTQVTNCYAADGKVCAVPTTFALPAIYGPGHIVSQIHDMDSLVAAAAQAKEEYPEMQSVLNGFLPAYLADIFYDSCSAAWMNPDGTLDESKLTEYYAGMKALFALDADLQSTLAEMMAEYGEEMPDYTPGDYTGLSGAMMMLMKSQSLTAGTLEGMEPWSWALAGDQELEGYETAHLNLQAKGIFLPRRIMGVLTTGANQELAAQFIAFMLSDEVQSQDLSTGFPVNKTTFDREIAEDRDVSDMTMGMSDTDGNSIQVVSLYPDARRRQELKGWVDSLTTPALTNRIIRGMVIAEMTPCLEGEITPEEAAQNAMKSLNLYLSE